MGDFTRCCLTALAAVVLAAAPSAAGPGNADWLERARLTGDWGGLRTRLEAHGVDVYAEYTAGVWANLGGGFETGARYEGFARWGIDLDFGGLLGWNDARFHVGWNSYHGGQPSLELVGVFPSTYLSDWEAEVSVRFYEIFFEKTWCDDRYELKLGQLSADDDFFVSEHSSELLNATFGYISLGRDRQIGPFYPLAAPGVYVSARPFEKWFARAGAYVFDPGEDVFENLGFDWSFDEGAFILVEAGTERAPLDRPGRYVVGFSALTANVIEFATGERVRGAYGFYAMLDQALLLDAGRDKLGVFLRGQYVPVNDRSLIHWVVDGGFRLRGPVPGRELDVASIGISHMRFSRDYVNALRAAGAEVSRRQTTLELTYRAQVTGWLTLQPDLQFFFDPHLSRRDAIAVGLRAVIEL